MVCHGLQGRHRHGLAEASAASRRLHPRRARAVQLRLAARSPDRRRAGRRGDHGSPGVHRQQIRCLPDSPAAPLRCTWPGQRRRRRAGRSSSWSRRMRRCCRTSSSALRRRVALGIGRQGGFGGNGSGDIFIAFSTANTRAWFARRPGHRSCKMLPNGRISPLFQATAQATEEAIINALLAAETMTGAERIAGLRDAGGPDARRDEEVRAVAVGLAPRLETRHLLSERSRCVPRTTLPGCPRWTHEKQAPPGLSSQGINRRPFARQPLQHPTGTRGVYAEHRMPRDESGVVGHVDGRPSGKGQQPTIGSCPIRCR